jgi:hypothetical protein
MDELTEVGYILGLAGLEVADEVPVKAIPETLVLDGQVLSAVLAHHFNAGLGEELHRLQVRVLRRRDDGDPGADFGADPLVVPPDLLNG